MVLFRILVFGLSLMMAVSALSQVVKLTPEQQAKDARISELFNHGQALLKAKKYEEALKVLPEGVALEVQRYGRARACIQLMAEAYAGLGRNEEAIAAYKQVVEYDASRQDLYGQWDVLSEYAVLLAKCGKMEEAKIIYYHMMRIFNPDANRSMEPMPMVIVFDPDPVGTYWEYTPERLCAAVLMMRTAMAPSHEEDFVAQAMKLAPDWAYPPLYRARSGVKETFLRYLHIAENLAQSDQEREWIRMYSVVRNLPNTDDLVEREEREHQRIGQKLRKECPAIQNSRLELPKTFSKVATQYRKSESTPSPGG